jgi:hypothetical protein
MNLDHPVIDSFLDFFLDRTTENLELRAFPSKKRVLLVINPSFEVYRPARKRESFWVRVQEQGGTQEHTRELFWLWADLDYKDYQGAGEARQTHLS